VEGDVRIQLRRGRVSSVGLLLIRPLVDERAKLHGTSKWLEGAIARGMMRAWAWRDTGGMPETGTGTGGDIGIGIGGGGEVTRRAAGCFGWMF
jgi:hypothetical protein